MIEKKVVLHCYDRDLIVNCIAFFGCHVLMFILIRIFCFNSNCFVSMVVTILFLWQPPHSTQTSYHQLTFIKRHPYCFNYYFLFLVKCNSLMLVPMNRFMFWLRQEPMQKFVWNAVEHRHKSLYNVDVVQSFTICKIFQKELVNQDLTRKPLNLIG